MKLIPIEVKYYDNGFAIPLLICLPLGSFLFCVGLGINSPACAIIGLIILALFLVFKIANWATAKSEQNGAIDEFNDKIRTVYNDMVLKGTPDTLAKAMIKKEIMDKYQSGEMDVKVALKIVKFIDNELGDI